MIIITHYYEDLSHYFYTEVAHGIIIFSLLRHLHQLPQVRQLLIYKHI